MINMNSYDVLTIYGAAAVSLMMIFYALESRSRWFTFLFAMSCIASAVYGWLAGAWPFGIVETVWGGVAFYKWYKLRKLSH
ncbi:MAG: hypothetical protein ACYCTB_06350 [bacterium]